MNTHQRYLIEEFAEDYRARRLGRRDLLRRTLLITGSIPGTAAILLQLGCGDGGGERDEETAPAGTPSPAATPSAMAASPTAAGVGPSPAASAPSSEPGGVSTEDVRFPGPAGDILAYLARPASVTSGSFPGVIVIHENRGLVDHTRDVTRRFAAEGYVALAVDLMSRNGGTKPDPNENAGLLGAARPEDLVADLEASISFLKAQDGVRQGGVGVTGFCFGGGYTWEIAIASSEVAAAVPYYGRVRRMDDLGMTSAAILAIYGQNDTRVTSEAETVRQRLTDAGKTFEIMVYPGADHAFFNDTGSRYHAEAASDAWARTLAWFEEHLPPA